MRRGLHSGRPPARVDEVRRQHGPAAEHQYARHAHLLQRRVLRVVRRVQEGDHAVCTLAQRQHLGQQPARPSLDCPAIEHHRIAPTQRARERAREHRLAVHRRVIRRKRDDVLEAVGAQVGDHLLQVALDVVGRVAQVRRDQRLHPQRRRQPRVQGGQDERQDVLCGGLLVAHARPVGVASHEKVLVKVHRPRDLLGALVDLELGRHLRRVARHLPEAALWQVAQVAVVCRAQRGVALRVADGDELFVVPGGDALALGPREDVGQHLVQGVVAMVVDAEPKRSRRLVADLGGLAAPAPLLRPEQQARERSHPEALGGMKKTISWV